MIDSIEIRVKHASSWLDGFEYIHHSDSADIHIIQRPLSFAVFDTDKYKILFLRTMVDPPFDLANTSDEVWVTCLEDKIKLDKNNVTKPIIILTKDPAILPYAMKDRLAYLQDKLNKEKGRYK